MRIQVECRAERASEGPRRFVLGEETIEVDDLLDRWYGGDADYFRVRGGDGHLYLLKYLRAHDRWELSSFTRCGSRGTNPGTPRARRLHRSGLTDPRDLVARRPPPSGALAVPWARC